MPTANELIAHGREVDEIRQIIGADGLIFRDLNDLIDAVRAENPDIQQFECSVFNGVYVTRDVDQQYLDYLDSLRNDDAKAVQLQNEVENLEMHNEGKSSIAASGVRRWRCLTVYDTKTNAVFLYLIVQRRSGDVETARRRRNISPVSIQRGFY